MMNVLDSVVIHLKMMKTSSFDQSDREKGSAVRGGVGNFVLVENESN